jgi:hypothetical protein
MGARAKTAGGRGQAPPHSRGQKEKALLLQPPPALETSRAEGSDGRQRRSSLFFARGHSSAPRSGGGEEGAKGGAADIGGDVKMGGVWGMKDLESHEQPRGSFNGYRQPLLNELFASEERKE